MNKGDLLLGKAISRLPVNRPTFVRRHTIPFLHQSSCSLVVLPTFLDLRSRGIQKFCTSFYAQIPFSPTPPTSARFLAVDQALLTADVPHLFGLPTRLLNSSEGEWLQEDSEEQLHIFQNAPAVLPIDRFDWRFRATSRVKRPKKDEDEEKQRSPRRKRLQGLEPDLEGLYYHASQNYKSKYVRSFLTEVVISVYIIFRFVHLLDLEEAEESAALKHRLSTWGLKRLEREGYCVTGLSAYWLEANHFGRPVASFSYGPGMRLSDNKLEFVAFLIFSITLLSCYFQKRHAGPPVTRRPAERNYSNWICNFPHRYAFASLLCQQIQQIRLEWSVAP